MEIAESYFFYYLEALVSFLVYVATFVIRPHKKAADKLFVTSLHLGFAILGLALLGVGTLFFPSPTIEGVFAMLGGIPATLLAIAGLVVQETVISKQHLNEINKKSFWDFIRKIAILLIIGTYGYALLRLPYGGNILFFVFLVLKTIIEFPAIKEIVPVRIFLYEAAIIAFVTMERRGNVSDPTVDAALALLLTLALFLLTISVLRKLKPGSPPASRSNHKEEDRQGNIVGNGPSTPTSP